MSAVTLLVAAMAVGVEVGWQPLPAGDYEYIVQVDPDALAEMRSKGLDVLGELPPRLVGRVRQVRFTIGRAKLPRPPLPDPVTEKQVGGDDRPLSPVASPPFSRPPASTRPAEPAATGEFGSPAAPRDPFPSEPVKRPSLDPVEHRFPPEEPEPPAAPPAVDINAPSEGKVDPFDSAFSPESKQPPGIDRDSPPAEASPPRGAGQDEPAGVEDFPPVRPIDRYSIPADSSRSLPDERDAPEDKSPPNSRPVDPPEVKSSSAPATKTDNWPAQQDRYRRPAVTNSAATFDPSQTEESQHSVDPYPPSSLPPDDGANDPFGGNAFANDNAPRDAMPSDFDAPAAGGREQQRFVSSRQPLTPSPPMTEPYSERQPSVTPKASPPAAGQSPPPKESPSSDDHAARPWWALSIALLLLFGSLGGNGYLGWLAWSFRERYRRMLRRFKDQWSEGEGGEND